MLVERRYTTDSLFCAENRGGRWGPTPQVTQVVYPPLTHPPLNMGEEFGLLLCAVKIRVLSPFWAVYKDRSALPLDLYIRDLLGHKKVIVEVWHPPFRFWNHLVTVPRWEDWINGGFPGRRRMLVSSPILELYVYTLPVSVTDIVREWLTLYNVNMSK